MKKILAEDIHFKERYDLLQKTLKEIIIKSESIKKAGAKARIARALGVEQSNINAILDGRIQKLSTIEKYIKLLTK